MIYCKLHRWAAAVFFCWAILLAACEQHRPAVLTQTLATDEKLLLSTGDQAEILAAFRSIAQDRTPVNPPRPATGGLRWSDVRQAAAWAVAEDGVEMAIVQTLRHDETGMVIKNVPFGERLVWCYTFRLKTIEDRPAQLIVRRRDDRSVYEATVTVGRFGDDHQRAEKLRSAFDHMMRAFGRKRGFNDDEP